MLIENSLPVLQVFSIINKKNTSKKPAIIKRRVQASMKENNEKKIVPGKVAHERPMIDKQAKDPEG